jgi:hypothetical protein
VISNGSQEESSCKEGRRRREESVEKEVSDHHRIFWGVVLGRPAYAGLPFFQAQL